MEDERWEPGMPVLDRQAVRTPTLPPSLQGLPPRSVPEVAPTPLQKHYINLSVIVLICGKLPTKITGDIKEEYGFLRSISHLGISLNSRDEVDHIAAMAKEEGCLLLGPMYRNEVVGYICVVTDPDGNNLEFSVEQDLG